MATTVAAPPALRLIEPDLGRRLQRGDPTATVDDSVIDLAKRSAATRHFRHFVEQAWPYLMSVPFVPGWHIDALVEHAEAVYYLQIRKLAAALPPRHTKPLDIDSLVLMADGSRRRLGDVRVGDSIISGLGRPVLVTAVAEQGRLPVLEIETFHGRRVRAAADHPFLTPAGYVRADKLAPGMSLAAIVPIVRANPSFRSEAFRLAGYFVGDGGVGQGPKETSCGAVITCYDALESEDIQRCASAMNFGVAVRARGRHTFTDGVRPWLREIGLAGKTARTKRVPAFVFNGVVPQIAEFLGAYFACDGGLTRKGHVRNGRPRQDLVISFSSVSRELLTDVQHLLLRLSIHARLRRRLNTQAWVQTSPYAGPEGYEYWMLEIGGQDNVARFHERIPFVHSAKGARLATWSPVRARFDERYLPDEITRITPAGEADCRCLSVSADASFTAGDLVVHNSTILSVLLPAWAWANDPGFCVMSASYAEELALDFSLASRTLMRSPWYRANWGHTFRFRPDLDKKGHYQNDQGGERLALGVGGSATGRGGDLRIVDDPVKVEDSAEANTHRAIAWWWDNVWTMRRKDPMTTRDIVAAARTHSQDLIAHVRAEGGWEYLKLPAEFVSAKKGRTRVVVDGKPWEDPRSQDGALLWPVRFPQAIIDEDKKKPLTHSAQNQQEPVPPGGVIYERAWWRYYVRPDRPIRPILAARTDGTTIEVLPIELPQDDPGEPGKRRARPAFDFMILSWDMAFKDGNENSFVVGQVWARRGGMKFLLDEVRGHWNFPKTLQHFKDQCQRWPKAMVKLVEDKANGPAVISTLQQEIQGLMAVQPDGSKIARASAVTWTIAAGDCYIPAPYDQPWIDPWLAEVDAFPEEPNDRGDAVSQALKYLTEHKGLGLSII